MTAASLMTPSQGSTLVLSPSALTTWMRCPRQYFYKHVLWLRAEPNEAAHLGTLMHAVFEAFHRGLPSTGHHPGPLVTLIDKLADDTLTDAAFAETFCVSSRRPLQAWQALGKLQRLSFVEQFYDAVNDLVNHGYFELDVIEALSEFRFEETTLPGLAGMRFKGTVDALLLDRAGGWHLLDYKRYGPGRFATKPDRARVSYAHCLEPLPPDATSHLERFASTDSRPRDYQLVLYSWLAESHAELMARGPLVEVALQLVRPQLADRPENGAIKLPLPLETLQARRHALADDIQRYLINPLLAAHQGEAPFETVSQPDICKRCDFNTICPGAAA